jgi:hypothetical protein
MQKLKSHDLEICPLQKQGYSIVNDKLDIIQQRVRYQEVFYEKNIHVFNFLH